MIDLTAIDFIDSRGLRLLKRSRPCRPRRNARRRRAAEQRRPERARHDGHEGRAGGSGSVVTRPAGGDYTHPCFGVHLSWLRSSFRACLRGGRWGPVPVRCSLWAAPTGTDTNPGTKASPLQSLDKLAKSFAPGQTGCLVPGSTFGKREAITAGWQGRQGPHHDHDRTGRPGAPCSRTASRRPRRPAT